MGTIRGHTGSRVRVQVPEYGMYSFCQLMTASMPTFIGRNITAIRPTHDCFYANLGHIMTAFMPTIGQIV